MKVMAFYFLFIHQYCPIYTRRFLVLSLALSFKFQNIVPALMAELW